MQDFELVILVLIFINCVSMAAYQPLDAKDSQRNKIIGIVETCATVVFTLEVALELAAAGTLRKYFKSSWNLFDFILVAAGYTKYLPFGDSTSAFKVPPSLLQACNMPMYNSNGKAALPVACGNWYRCPVTATRGLVVHPLQWRVAVM